MVRICTGEVCVRSSRRSRCDLPFLPGDEERVLGVARRVIGRKVERLKIVVVALDLRPFGDRITHGDEDGNDLVHRPQHRMAHAELAVNAGQGHVDALGGELLLGTSAGYPLLRCRDGLFHLMSELVDLLADVSLVSRGRGLQPSVIDLRQDAALARHPAVAKCLQIRIVSDRRAFLLQGLQQLTRGRIQRLGRVIFEFWDGVHYEHLTSISSRMSSERNPG